MKLSNDDLRQKVDSARSYGNPGYVDVFLDHSQKAEIDSALSQYRLQQEAVSQPTNPVFDFQKGQSGLFKVTAIVVMIVRVLAIGVFGICILLCVLALLLPQGTQYLRGYVAYTVASGSALFVINLLNSWFARKLVRFHDRTAIVKNQLSSFGPADFSQDVVSLTAVNADLNQQEFEAYQRQKADDVSITKGKLVLFNILKYLAAITLVLCTLFVIASLGEAGKEAFNNALLIAIVCLPLIYFMDRLVTQYRSTLLGLSMRHKTEVIIQRIYQEEQHFITKLYGSSGTVEVPLVYKTPKGQAYVFKYEVACLLEWVDGHYMLTVSNINGWKTYRAS